MKYITRLLSLLTIVIIAPFYITGYVIGQPIASIYQGYKDGRARMTYFVRETHKAWRRK